jgi:hypothetical protein
MPRARHLAVVVAVSRKISRVDYSAEGAKVQMQLISPHAYRCVAGQSDASRAVFRAHHLTVLTVTARRCNDTAMAAGAFRSPHG